MHYTASFGGVYFTERNGTELRSKMQNGTGLKRNATGVPISLASQSFYVFVLLFRMCSQLHINPNW